jgi:23S rRNA (cytosine1962-C5)-methyltransferase
MTLPRLFLKPGREKSLLRRHPWIFSGAVERIEGEVEAGAELFVADAKGKILAVAGYSPASQIAARVWSFDPDEKIDAAFFRKRIAAAVDYRRRLGLMDVGGGCRLIFSEGDALPGVVADRYGEFAVVQFLSAPAERCREIVADELTALGLKGVYERSDASIRRKEGLPERSGVMRGAEPPAEIVVEEAGDRFAVDVRCGQKTGFYFDLRDARQLVRRLAPGKKVLNAFSYTGAFGVAALKSGAAGVVNIDSSRPALRAAERNYELNGLAAPECVCADVFDELRRRVASGEKYELVILDPPKLVASQRDLVRGCRAYQDLARLGFMLTAAGGFMLNFSCSGLMTMELLEKVTASAALEAGVSPVLAGTVRQAADHPVALAVPEGAYLKGRLNFIGI